MSVQIQVRKDSAADWVTANPTLADGEIGFETDTFRFKIGNGSLAWSALRYAASSLPVNSQSAAYTTAWKDAGGVILHPAADNNARTFTIDANADVAYPVGTTLTFVNEINTVTIAIDTDTLVLASSGATGSRTLAAGGMATALKITSTKWVISGAGLT